MYTSLATIRYRTLEKQPVRELPRLVPISQTSGPIDFLSVNTSLQCKANVQGEHPRHTLNMQGNPQRRVMPEHRVLDPTKLRQHNMDQSRWLLWTGEVEVSPVVLIFELEFR